MLLKENFSRPLLQTYSGEDCITITGQPIAGNSKDSIERLLADDSYPLRYQLQILQLSIITRLIRDEEDGPLRKCSEIIAAVGVLKEELLQAMSDIIAGGFVEFGKKDLSEDALAEIGGNKTDRFGVSRATYSRSPLRSWATGSNPQDVFECIYSTSVLLKDGSGWDYGDVCGMLGLWCIDEAVSYINAQQPYKAAAWAMYAASYEDWQFACSEFEGVDTTKDNVASLFSKRGLDVRHASNREVKARALSLYSSKQWPSQAEAARRIATEVSRTELVVMRWIREYKKNQ